jgi:hypothetical protein
MSASVRHHALVVVLILAAAVAGAGVSGQTRPNPPLPAVATLMERGAWQVETAYAPGDAGMTFRQWLLRDQAGSEALLYVGATSRVQVMVRWSGELGYLGEGYLVTGRGERTIALGDGSAATVSSVLVQRLTDRRLLAYAVVGPEGIAPSGTASPLATARDVVTGRAGPYYLVRVSVPVTGTAPPTGSADRLLAAALRPLATLARTG